MIIEQLNQTNIDKPMLQKTEYQKKYLGTWQKSPHVEYLLTKKLHFQNQTSVSTKKKLLKNLQVEMI